MSGTRKRVLIVNCYFPGSREVVRLPYEIPNALAPVLLAGMLSHERCDIRLHNEVSDGFLEIFAPELLAWPDLLVFTGLTAAFDRMLHISAYVRTLNPAVVTVAGGPAIRAFPRYARAFFDYVCEGDVEDLGDVIAEALGPAYVAEEPWPRYDLAGWIGRYMGYAESSRSCNFRCSFCSLTAEGRAYTPRSLDDLRRQIVAMGRREVICFQDNQFYGTSERFFRDRMGLLQELRRAGYFRYWHAFVTNAFLWNDANITLAREAGCFSLFVGVESFDQTWLRRMNKTQNTHRSQVELIQKCLEAGILFQYALVFDPTERTLAEMHRELALICNDRRLPAPNVIFMAVPFPGTPFFRERLARGLILPGTRVRDLEGSTLSLRPLDAIEDVAHFVGTAKHLQGYVWRHLRRQARFLWNYRKSLSVAQGWVSSVISASVLAPSAVSNPTLLLAQRHPRTHISTTDRLDPVYRPVRRVGAKYAAYFRPTLVTDSSGHLNENLATDLVEASLGAR